MVNSLEDLLRTAAQSTDWQREVVHRCAWCQHIMSADRTPQRVVALAAGTVVTDGMCNACGTRALAELQRRAA
jgi:hypothetical protein